jgi:hypothetical protein
MRKLIPVALVLLFSSPVFAQRTVVTGQVIDPNGIPWQGGTMVATLSLPVGVSGATLNGVQIGGSTQRVTLDSTGSFLMQLPDNNVVQPPGTQWTFAINISPGEPPPFGTGPQQFTQTFTITGASQTIAFSPVPALTHASSTQFITGSIQAISAGSPKYGLKNDLRFSGDAVTTLNSPIVTSATIQFQCPASVFPCVTGGDVGKTIYTVNAATGGSAIVGSVGGVPGSGDAKILSVQSPTQATASVNATVSETGDTLVVASNDTVALQTAWADVKALNSTLLLPCPTTQPSFQQNSGGMLVTAHLFDVNNAPDTFPLNSTFLVFGCAGSSDMIVPAPNFDFSSCLFACIYGVQTQNVRINPGFLAKLTRMTDFTIQGFSSNFLGHGSGLTCQGGTQLCVWIVAPYFTQRIQILGFGGSPGPILFLAQESETNINELNMQGNPSTGPMITLQGSPATVIRNSIVAFNGIGGSPDSIRCTGSSQVLIDGGLFNQRMNLGNCTDVYVRNVQSIREDCCNLQGVTVASGGTAFIDHSTFFTAQGTTGIGLQVLAGGTAHIKNDDFQTSGGNVSINNAGTLFDDGGNNPGTGALFVNTGTVVGDGSITGVLDVAGNHALTSGWGTANVNTVSGFTKDVRLTISVTGGAPAAGPVLTDTFANPFFVTPGGGCTLLQVGGTFGVLSNPVASALSTTGVTWTFTGTPVVGQSYSFARHCSNN